VSIEGSGENITYSWFAERDGNYFNIEGTSPKENLSPFATRYNITGNLVLTVPKHIRKVGRNRTVTLRNLKRHLHFDYTLAINANQGCSIYKNNLARQFGNSFTRMISNYYKIPASRNCTGAVIARANPSNRLSLVYNGRAFRRGRIQFRSNKRRTFIKMYHSESEIGIFRMFYGRLEQKFYTMRKFDKFKKRWKMFFQIPGAAAFPYIQRSINRILYPYKTLFIAPFMIRDKYFRKFADKESTFVGLENAAKTVLYYDHVIAQAARCPFTGSHIDACDSYPWQHNKRLFSCGHLVRDVGLESEIFAEMLEIASVQDSALKFCRQWNSMVYYWLDKAYFGVKSARVYLIQSIVDNDEIDSILDKLLDI